MVTNDYHTRRARWIFNQVLGELTPQVSLVSIPCDEFPADRWWQYPAGAKAVVSEYLKLAFYVFRYGSGVYWVLAGTASVAGGWWWRRIRAARDGVVNACQNSPAKDRPKP